MGNLLLKANVKVWAQVECSMVADKNNTLGTKENQKTARLSFRRYWNKIRSDVRRWNSHKEEFSGTTWGTLAEYRPVRCRQNFRTYRTLMVQKLPVCVYMKTAVFSILLMIHQHFMRNSWLWLCNSHNLCIGFHSLSRIFRMFFHWKNQLWASFWCALSNCKTVSMTIDTTGLTHYYI